jgi:hypothetical protein
VSPTAEKSYRQLGVHDAPPGIHTDTPGSSTARTRSPAASRPEAELSEAIDATSVFTKLAPAHKEHIIRTLQSKGQVVGTLGFVPLPSLYWLMLAIMLPGYVILTQVVKTWFFHRFGE